MSLYPSLAVPTISDDKSNNAAESLDQSEMEPQNFRLQKIGELESFLRSEVEFRSALFKKYSRAVNMINGFSASSAVFGLGAGAGGARRQSVPLHGISRHRACRAACPGCPAARGRTRG